MSLLFRKVISSLSPVMEEQVTLCEPNLSQALSGLEFLLASGTWKTKLYSSRPFSSHVAATALICILLLSPHALILLVGIEFVVCLHVCWFAGGSVHCPMHFCSVNQVLERTESRLVATTMRCAQFKSSNSVTKSQSHFQR